MKNYRKNTSPPNCSWFILAKQKYIAESPSLWNLKICSVYEAGLYIFATVYCGTSPTNIYKGFTYILVLFSVLFFTLFNYIGNLKLFSWCTFRSTHTTYEDWLLVVYCLGIELDLPLPCEAVGLCGWGTPICQTVWVLFASKTIYFNFFCKYCTKQETVSHFAYIWSTNLPNFSLKKNVF